MERTMEEKIRRAEEIYARRREGEIRPQTTVSINNNSKKDIKLLKKMIIQIIICILIYLSIYTIQNSEYIFSQDFIQKVKEILTYDTNFNELYQNTKNKITEWITLINPEKNTENEENTENKENQENTNPNEQAIGGTENSEENIEVENQGDTEENSGSQEVTNSNYENQTEVTQEEQDIENIKKTASFIKPVQGTITSKYGLRDPSTTTVPKNHTGTDIAANTGTKIISATDGEVVLSSEEGDYGKHLKIQIGEVSVIYAHCNNLYVKQGDKITQGQEIAEVGSTGNSTGPHLHFEIRYQERTIDPEKILELQ